MQDVVSFGAGPAPVDDDLIGLLRVRAAEIETRGPAPALVPGEQVMIQDGPLRNLVGIFEREIKGSERVAVLLSAIHCRARAVVNSNCLTKLG